MGEVSNGMLARLQARRTQIRASAETLLQEARAQGRNELSPGEAARLQHMLSDLDSLGEQLEERRFDRERSTLPPHLARIGQQITGNPERPTPMFDSSSVYRSNSGPSWLRDLMRTKLGMDETGESRERLGRHAEDVANFGGYEQRNIDRIDGTGGYAVPPAWLMNQYVELARPGRAFANLCNRQMLPGGTDSINVPKLLTGTTVDLQTADNTAVSETDLTDTFINAPVRTIAGQQGVAIQLIDQSPIAFDDVIFRDLTAAHSAVLDRQCLYGTGSNGQVLGVVNTPNIHTIPITSMDIKGIYSVIANAIQTILTTRFQPPEVILMHPRRWAWLLTLLDQNNRPLFLPEAGSPWNAAGVLTDVDSQQVVGQTCGLPIVTDPNITTTSGGSGSTLGVNDEIYVLRSSDILLWESGIRARVLPEPRASTLTVLLQIYSYFAFAASRYPQSIVQVTGLTPPTF
jgi:HK97 family phage major capsid protein